MRGAKARIGGTSLTNEATSQFGNGHHREVFLLRLNNNHVLQSTDRIPRTELELMFEKAHEHFELICGRN